MKTKKAKFIIWLLVIGLIFSQTNFFMGINYAQAAESDLIITGSGINNEVIISSADWSKYNLTERTYSTNNSLGFHKIVKVKGYDLFELIGINNLKNDQDYTFKFTCSDGFEFEKTLSELKNTYFYSNFTEDGKTAVFPMIAKYTAVLADFPKNNFNPPIIWENRSLTENDIDKDFPKLVFGQTNIDDMNMSKWGKNI